MVVAAASAAVVLGVVGVGVGVGIAAAAVAVVVEVAAAVDNGNRSDFNICTYLSRKNPGPHRKDAGMERVWIGVSGSALAKRLQAFPGGHFSAKDLLYF